MNDESVAVRSKTLTLDGLIQAAIKRTETADGPGPLDRMVFLGNQHHAFPTAMVKDPVLEPVDKLVWMVIMLGVRETGGNKAFPGYESIGKMANVASRSTIARAIAILRATRWLSLCAQVRNRSGRFCGNVYALHDEPLPLADALHLDSDYLGFLDQALAHAHARVRTVAKGVLDSIEEDRRAGQELDAQPHPIERRLQSVAIDGRESRRCFSVTRKVVTRLRLDLANREKGDDHHDQNSNTAGDRVRISNSVCCSSSYIKTTTTTSAALSKFVHPGEEDRPLVYPARLCDQQREVADRYLRLLTPEQRQPVLDELEGRFRAEKQGMKPVYDEIRFLSSLCKLMKEGKFQPNLGIKVRDGRRGGNKSASNASPVRSALPPRERDAQWRKRKTLSKARIAEMRQRLGQKPTTKNQSVMCES